MRFGQVIYDSLNTFGLNYECGFHETINGKSHLFILITTCKFEVTMYIPDKIEFAEDMTEEKTMEFNGMIFASNVLKLREYSDVIKKGTFTVTFYPEKKKKVLANNKTDFIFRKQGFPMEFDSECELIKGCGVENEWGR